jgi:hypothetical protein
MKNVSLGAAGDELVGQAVISVLFMQSVKQVYLKSIQDGKSKYVTLGN